MNSLVTEVSMSHSTPKDSSNGAPLTTEGIAFLAATLRHEGLGVGDAARQILEGHQIPAAHVAEALLTDKLDDQEQLQVAEACVRDYTARMFAPDGTPENPIKRHLRLRACRADLLPILRKHEIMAWRVLERIPEHECPGSDWVNVGLALGLPHEALRVLSLFRSALTRSQIEHMMLQILGVPGALRHPEARDLVTHLVDNPAPHYSLALAMRSRLASFLRGADESVE